MNKLLTLTIFLITSGLCLGQANKPIDPKLLPQKGTHYVDQNQVAMEGYDVVSYFTNKGPEKGKAKFSTNYDGVKYHFTSRANLNAFKKDPSKYLPMYGGFCAFGLGKTGKKFAVDPETYKIIDNKLYLFFVGPINGKITNSRDNWNRDEDALKSAADKAWEAAKNQK